MDNLFCEYDFDCKNCVWHDDMFIQTYYLYDDEGEIDQVQGYCIDFAVDVFKDNYNGKYKIICEEEEWEVIL